MSTPILATKLYIPPPRQKFVARPRLLERLNESLQRKPGVILLSTPAGFGKTTLVSEWIHELRFTTPVAWLSLDKGDNDPARFLTYLIAALQTLSPDLGKGLLRVLQSPQPPPIESILTTLLNEVSALPEEFVLVLDDYHVIDAKPVDQALQFMFEHLPPQMHLIIATREDPPLPLARLRARDQLTELRVADLRFTPAEAAGFLNQVMSLDLSVEDVAALEARTEGWIAGLQLAAISMQGHRDAAGFIKSFTGSHHFVMDYLVEEVLAQQSEQIQTFLLRTSILERLCGPLCEAVLLDASASGQETLEALERANLFLIPLDNARGWYRYHHLFADLLRQRLPQSIAASREEAQRRIDELHIRASQWYEDHNLDLEAFQHAAAGHDVERAERIADGRGLPLHLNGAVNAILEWLGSLPASVMDGRPSLWWRYGAMLLVSGQSTGVEEKLHAAETALNAARQGRPEAEQDAETRHLLGRIAAARATLALTRYDVAVMLAESQRALEYLEPENSSLRANAHWTLGFAYFLQGDRRAARRILTEAVALSQTARDIFTNILANISLGSVLEMDNELHTAAEIYRQVLQLAGDQPQQIISEAHLGMARILYEWNDLETSARHTEQSLHLARQYDTRIIDRSIIGELFLARLKWMQGETAEAEAILAQAAQSVYEHHFVHRMTEVAAAQVLMSLQRGDLETAAQLAQAHELPLLRARVQLAQGDPSAASTTLSLYRQQMEARGWEDERLKAMVLQALALQARGEKEQALQVLGQALALAEPHGFIRLFVDEGAPMKELLAGMKAEGGRMKGYIEDILAAFQRTAFSSPHSAFSSQLSALSSQRLGEPLSPRELEVLQLIAQGLSNDEISKRLYLALDTVKGHNRRIFDKLRVQRRTEAVARARELGLL